MSAELPPVLQPPEQPRRLRFHRFQWVGLSLMLLIPILALAGVFGESLAHTDGSSGAIALRVEYPTRYRYKQINTMQVAVENLSGARLDTVVVAFDTAYVRRFSTLMFIPSPKQPFDIEFLGLEPGETRHVWLELQAERYGRHRGTVEAYRPGSPDTARVDVSTFIFP